MVYNKSFKNLKKKFIENERNNIQLGIYIITQFWIFSSSIIEELWKDIDIYKKWHPSDVLISFKGYWYKISPFDYTSRIENVDRTLKRLKQ